MDEYEPITGELRKAFVATGGAFVASTEITKLDGNIVEDCMVIAKSKLNDLCDAIDAVHAELERENERLREKVRRQGAQLTEVQGALERRNNGELKRHWQKELNRVKAERDSMAAALDAAQGEHAYAPESHYVMLPKDADGVPIHVGDVMERGKARGHVIALMLSEYPKKWGGELHWGVQLEGEQVPTALDALFHHYHAPTVEDVLREFAEKMNENIGMYTSEAIDADEWRDADAKTIAEYAAKLRLAGEK